MQSSEAYRTDGIVTESGDIHAAALPFEQGQRVELVIWRSSNQDSNDVLSQEEIARRVASFDELVQRLRDSRPKGLPPLADEAISRETIYEDRGM